MKTITAESFATDVLQAKGPVLVYFRSDSRAEFKNTIDPWFAEMERVYSGKLTIVSMTTTAGYASKGLASSYPTMAKYGVQSDAEIPAMIMFKGGNATATTKRILVQKGSAPSFYDNNQYSDPDINGKANVKAWIDKNL